MIFSRQNKRSGFTLVELAIVLGVAGLLFGGLWRILSTSNSQMRDQAAAGQQQQLISAISTYLQTQEGQAYMAAIAASGNGLLALPSVQAAAAGIGTAGPPATGCYNDVNMKTTPTHVGLCGILPPGFWSGTTNSYGQQYAIRILKDGTTNVPATAPQTYSFMILTSGGDQIPDAAGGRISAMIGGDGGFVYNSNVCNAANTHFSCGSFGAWNNDLVSYGFGYPGTGGFVASRSYYSPTQSMGTTWLSRTQIDAGGYYNTMQTALSLNSMALNLTTTKPAVLASGQITGAIAAATSLAIPFVVLDSSAGLNASNPLVELKTPCTLSSSPAPVGGCNAALFIPQGDIQLSNGAIFASSFAYNSDARLKKDIKPLNNSLDQIMALKPVSFTYKANNRQGLGIIAQDLEKIYPQLVTLDPSGMRAVSYDGLIAPLIDAVQQLKKENGDLKEQLQQEAVHNKAIEDRLKALEH